MKDEEWYYDTSHPFHVVSGTGEGGVSLLIRKNFIVWIFRLFIYFETSRYVLDSRGLVIVYNKIELLAAILDRKHKVHASYWKDGYDSLEYHSGEYNDVWAGKLFYFSERSIDKAELLKDPYQFWIKGYKAHFQLETPFGRRKHYAYYRPIN